MIFDSGEGYPHFHTGAKGWRGWEFGRAGHPMLAAIDTRVLIHPPATWDRGCQEIWIRST